MHGNVKCIREGEVNMDDWFEVYAEYCCIMGIEKNKRDEIIFMAGYSFACIERGTK